MVVWLVRFERTTPTFRTLCANRAALQPEIELANCTGIKPVSTVIDSDPASQMPSSSWCGRPDLNRHGFPSPSRGGASSSFATAANFGELRNEGNRPLNFA